MKIGFFHDHQFFSKDNNIYTTGTLNYRVWERYLFDDISEIVICARKVEYSPSLKGEISSIGDVSFRFSPSLSNVRSLLNLSDDKTVENAVKEVDFVIARLPSEIGFKAIALSKKYRKKVICEVVGCPYDGLSHHGSIQAKLYAPLIAYRMRKLVEQCDGAIYVTDYTLQQRFPNNKLTTNVSNVEISSIESNCLELRVQRFNDRLKRDELKLGVIGSFKNDIKGIGIAIKAMSNVPGALHALGSGDSSRFSVIAEEQSVLFNSDGFLSSKDDVFAWLDDIDVYLQPSFQEGLPRATVEAMSRGCPVLTSNAGGLPELTHKDFVHTMGDFQKLNCDIIRLIENDLFAELVMHSLNTSKKYLHDGLCLRRKNFIRKFVGS